MSDDAYARAQDGTHVAYRVLPSDGPGSDDIVMVSGGLIPMGIFDDDSGLARLLEGLRSLGRVVVFDRRGIGLSDPIVDWERPVLDQWAEDLAAVVETSGVRDAAVFAWDGFGIATRFAATHPDRLRMLVLQEPTAIADDRWAAWAEQRLGRARRNVAGEDDDFLEQLAPSRAEEPAFRDWYERAGRVGASPATAARIWASVFGSRPGDQLLGRVATPTLVLHRPGCRYVPDDAVRRAAAAICGARLVELGGIDYFPFIGDVDSVVAEISQFLVGERRLPPPQRLLAAVMFTDLVSSTERAASLGDARWKAVLDRHDAAVRKVVGRCGGTIVKTTGDGVLALLPAAGSAVRAAEGVRGDLRAEGLDVRIGIHVGDVDRRGDDVSGLGVVVAARVMAAAATGQIVVTASVPAALVGQPVTFESLGNHRLKGIPGEWELLLLAGTDGT